MKNDGGPAFPCEVSFYEGSMHGRQTGNTTGIHTGLTLRDYFAAKVLQGRSMVDEPWEVTAKQAYLAADAMLAERAKA